MLLKFITNISQKAREHWKFQKIFFYEEMGEYYLSAVRKYPCRQTIESALEDGVRYIGITDVRTAVDNHLYGQEVYHRNAAASGDLGPVTVPLIEILQPDDNHSSSHKTAAQWFRDIRETLDKGGLPAYLYASERTPLSSR